MAARSVGRSRDEEHSSRGTWVRARAAKLAYGCRLAARLGVREGRATFSWRETTYKMCYVNFARGKLWKRLLLVDCGLVGTPARLQGLYSTELRRPPRRACDSSSASGHLARLDPRVGFERRPMTRPHITSALQAPPVALQSRALASSLERARDLAGRLPGGPAQGPSSPPQVPKSQPSLAILTRFVGLRYDHVRDEITCKPLYYNDLDRYQPGMITSTAAGARSPTTEPSNSSAISAARAEGPPLGDPRSRPAVRGRRFERRR